MIFDYLRTTTALDTIDIIDIGNCSISAINDDAEEWFIIIDTNEGWTKIREFGPILSDDNKIKTFFNYDCSATDFSEKKIKIRIDKFLNNPRRMITQVNEVEKVFAQDRLNSILKQL